jgi:hypothetical protein
MEIKLNRNAAFSYWQIFFMLFLTSCYQAKENSALKGRIDNIHKTILINRIVYDKFKQIPCSYFGINKDTTKSMKSLEIINKFIFYKSGYSILQNMDILFENELLDLFPCLTDEENIDKGWKLISVMISKDKNEIYWSFVTHNSKTIFIINSIFSKEENKFVVDGEIIDPM